MWHGVTPAAKAAAYDAYLRCTGVKSCRETPGNRGVTVLRHVEGERAHFLFISYWESLDAIRAFAGAEYERAVYYPEDQVYLLELEPTVTHYDVVQHRSDTP